MVKYQAHHSVGEIIIQVLGSNYSSICVSLFINLTSSVHHNKCKRDKIKYKLQNYSKRFHIRQNLRGDCTDTIVLHAEIGMEFKVRILFHLQKSSSFDFRTKLILFKFHVNLYKQQWRYTHNGRLWFWRFVSSCRCQLLQ